MRQALAYRNSRVCKIRTSAGSRAAVVAKSAQVGCQDDWHKHAPKEILERDRDTHTHTHHVKVSFRECKGLGT